jgi:hypothetical protein
LINDHQTKSLLNMPRKAACGGGNKPTSPGEFGE